MSEVASCFVSVRANQDRLASDMSSIKGMLGKGIGAAKLAGFAAFENFGQGLAGMVQAGMALLTGNVKVAAQSAGRALGTMLGAGIGLAIGDVTGATARTFGQLGDTLGGILGSGLQRALVAETSGVKMDALLRSTGQTAGWTREQLEYMNKELQKTSTFGANDIRAAQSKLLMLDVRGGNFREALKISEDLAATMGGDLAEAASTLGMALVNPEHGMRRLRHEGVMLSEQQMDQIKMLYASGDAARAQAALLGMVGTKIKGMAEAMQGTTEGQFALIQRDFGGIMGAIGSLVLPPFKAIVTAFRQGADAIRDFLAPVFEEMKVRIGAAMSAIGGFVTANRETFMKWGALIKNIAGNVVDGLLRAIDWTGEKWKAMTDVVGQTSAWTTAKNVITSVLDAFSLLTTDPAKSFSYLLDQVKIVALNIKDQFFTVLESVADLVATSMDDILKRVDDMIDKGIKKFIASLPSIKGVIDAFWAHAFDAVPGGVAAKQMFDMFKANKAQIEAAGTDTATALLDPNKAKIKAWRDANNDAIDALKNDAAGLLADIRKERDEAEKTRKQKELDAANGPNMESNEQPLPQSGKTGTSGFSSMAEFWKSTQQSAFGNNSMFMSAEETRKATQKSAQLLQQLIDINKGRDAAPGAVVAPDIGMA